MGQHLADLDIPAETSLRIGQTDISYRALDGPTSNAEDGMENIYPVSWSICYTALVQILYLSAESALHASS